MWDFYLLFSLVLGLGISSPIAATSQTQPSDSAPKAATQKDIVAKRLAVIADNKSKDDNCGARRTHAAQNLATLEIEGADKNSNEWRKARRKLTVIKGQCPLKLKTASVMTSMCNSRENALIKKLQTLKSADFAATNEEVVFTENELMETQKQCATKALN